MRGLVERHVAGHSKTLEHDGLHAAVCWRRNACCSSTTLPALSVERLKTASARRPPTSSTDPHTAQSRYRQLQRFSRTESVSDSSGRRCLSVTPKLEGLFPSNTALCQHANKQTNKLRQTERVPRHPQCEQRKWSNQRHCLSRYETHK